MLDIDLIKRELLSSTFVTKIYYFDEIDSTNSYAKNLANEDNVLVISEYQHRGKGRYERLWESEKGSNLTFSIRKKFDVKHDEVPFINFYFTYFVYSGIKAYLKENNIDTSLLNIKWPNDILYDNKKICGLLIESNLNSKEFTIGIGININQKNFNPEFNAYSLYNIINSETDTTRLLISLVKNLDMHLSWLLSPVNVSIYELWVGAANLNGKIINFSSAEGEFKFAKIIDLQRDGGIKLLINGEEHVYYSGEIKITLSGS